MVQGWCVTGAEADLSAYAEPLEVARGLVRLGVPVFTAESRGGGRFYYPPAWERMVPDETVIDRWRPGMALCAVTGIVFDVIDVDPRNGGLASFQSVYDLMTTWAGRSRTASGGWHDWFLSLGLRKKTGLLPGIDYQGGAPDGQGRGFVFLPPTVRPSKADGQLNPYVWEHPPTIGDGHVGNEALRDLILRSTGSSAGGTGSSDYTDPDLDPLITGGIPAGEDQDPVLRDVVWKLVLAGHGDAMIEFVWWTIVNLTPQTREESWEAADFLRHLNSAREKLGKPMTPEERFALLPTGAGENPDDGELVPAWYRDLFEGDPALQRRALQRRFDRETDRIARADEDERERRRLAAAVVNEIEVLDGEAFIFKEVIEVESFWGRGDTVLWPKDEGLMIAGPQNIGKTVLEQNLMLRRIGIGQGDLLGYPVVVNEDPDALFLYLAMDRPAQARRSIRRMVADNPVDRGIVQRHLRFWAGPLPLNPATGDPARLIEWATAYCGGRVPSAIFCDSYKDLAVGLSKDEVGSAINLAVQACIMAGAQWVGAHHHRKGDGQRAPRSLDDVYGSTWLTSGLGSVAMVWGNPGSLTVELSQLKSPADQMDPIHLVHDPVTGWLTIDVDENVEPLDVVGRRGEAGITAPEFGFEMYHDQPSAAAARTRAKRTLDRLVGTGELVRFEDPASGRAGRRAYRYRLARYDLPAAGPSADTLRVAFEEGEEAG